MKKIKVALMYEKPSDQCAWYRMTTPFSDSIFRENNIEFKFLIQYRPEHWDQVIDCDILFALRPFKKIEHDMIIMAMSLGIKVWVDYDDDFTVPEQCKWSSQNITTQEFFTKSLWLSSKITVSTGSIKDIYEKLSEKEVECIPNGFDLKHLRGMNRPGWERSNSVAWRGSETHEKDLQEIAVPYTLVMKKHPEFVTFFYGSYPKFLAYYVNHTQMGFPIPQFHNVLADNRHKIVMHPLEDTQWNRGKSNAAWLEGTMAGATIISRDLPEWNRPNCYTYKTQKEFHDVVERLVMMGKEEHDASVALGKEYICDKLDLAKLNQRRVEIIKELVG